MKLICPICGKPLEKINQSAVCENRHCFDYAKQGYLNLLLKQSVSHGDGKDMVQARTAFLSRGFYGFLRDEISRIVSASLPHVLADLGCGEGYYTSALKADEKYGFDMSKDALKHAAKTDPSTQYVISSIFHLPLPDESCDFMLTCFAPFAEEEVERCLKKDGIFLFVSPGPKHLIEMKELLYEHPYLNEVKEPDTTLSETDEHLIESSFTADHQTLLDLFTMTPYVHRTPAEDKKKLEETDSLQLTAQFVLRTYKKLQ